MRRYRMILLAGMFGSLGGFPGFRDTEALAIELAPIQGSVCVRASMDRLGRLANALPDWTQIPESVYRVGKFQLIRLVSTQTAPWEQAVSSSAILSALPESERISKSGPGAEDLLAYFFFQPGQLGEDYSTIYPRFVARCSSQMSGQSFRQDCQQISALEHYGVDSFTSTVSAISNDSCPVDSQRFSYDIRVTLNDSEIKRIRDALLGGFSMLAGLLAPPETFIRGYFENFYPGWKAYAEKP